jgi:hypothetical protein
MAAGTLAAGGALACLAMAGASASPAKTGPGVHRDATNACGSACVDVHFLVPGEHALVTSESALNTTNNPVRLTQGSNGAAKQDFTEVNLSHVVPLYCSPGGQAQPGSVFTSRQCALLHNAGLSGATTFQLAFNPYGGGPETECIGSEAVNPQSGAKARLEPCGSSAATVMVVTNSLPTGTTTAGSLWIISGGSDNFSNPLVLTSTGAYPSDLRWQTVVVNGGKGQDTQEARGAPGPYTV